MTQLDLFGKVEKAEQEAREREKVNAEWHARFERAEWVAPGPTADGKPAGTVWLGYRCPDRECGEVEPTAFALSINHGWDPGLPGRAPWDGRCRQVWLLAAQARYDAMRAMIRHLAAEGMDDEQIAARVRWPASSVAGYRKEDAKAARLAAKAAKGEIVKVEHGAGCPCAYCDGPCACQSCESFRRNPIGL